MAGWRVGVRGWGEGVEGWKDGEMDGWTEGLMERGIKELRD